MGDDEEKKCFQLKDEEIKDFNWLYLACTQTIVQVSLSCETAIVLDSHVSRRQQILSFSLTTVGGQLSPCLSSMQLGVSLSQLICDNKGSFYSLTMPDYSKC